MIFGFAVFEPTFKVIEDKDYGTVTTLNDLGFRKQNSIEKWFLNEDGTIKAIRQEVTGTDHDVNVLINGDEILVFTNDKEGDNYEGISLLRGSYGPWLRKQMFHKIEYIGIEKNSIGTPIFYAPKSLRQNAKEKKNLEDILATYTSHEKAGLILPEEMKDNGFEIKEGKYNSDAVDMAIKREDLAILDSVKASFLAIGTTVRGGDKQTEQLASLFLDSLEQIGIYISEILSPLVHQVYVMNFGEPKEVLNLRAMGINKKDFGKVSTTLKNFVDAGLITPDDGIEYKIRNEMELPQKEEQQESDREEEKKEDAKQEEEKEESLQFHHLE